MAGAGKDVSASNVLGAGVAGRAGRDESISDPLAVRDRSYANVRRRRWFNGCGVLPALSDPRLQIT